MNPPENNAAAIAEHRFDCTICGRETGVVRLFGTPADARIIRSSFMSDLTYRIEADAFERVRAIIEAGDVRAIYDFNLEIASFFCPTCNLCYCGEHWVHWDVFDDEDGFFWHDSIRGRCPRGHERMLED
ncbi:MAG: hypothetical protein M3362_27210 [Acidobacteriota bacterium]|nr:hypothetical protein [Acidobacteriota bacterium]